MNEAAAVINYAKGLYIEIVATGSVGRWNAFLRSEEIGRVFIREFWLRPDPDLVREIWTRSDARVTAQRQALGPLPPGAELVVMFEVDDETAWWVTAP